MYKFSTDFTDSGDELFKLKFEILKNSSEPLKKKNYKIASFLADGRRPSPTCRTSIGNSQFGQAQGQPLQSRYAISNF